MPYEASQDSLTLKQIAEITIHDPMSDLRRHKARSRLNSPEPSGSPSGASFPRWSCKKPKEPKGYPRLMWNKSVANYARSVVDSAPVWRGDVLREMFLKQLLELT